KPITSMLALSSRYSYFDLECSVTTGTSVVKRNLGIPARLFSSLFGGDTLTLLPCFGVAQGSNKVALGYDDGTIMIKLGHEEPVVSMDRKWMDQGASSCCPLFPLFPLFSPLHKSRWSHRIYCRLLIQRESLTASCGAWPPCGVGCAQ